ncbi:NAD-dependent epimerase/dehydratase family protein [Streptomyces shenzhenensis]|uniref:NAD-dependent epimerase/dehydratase family protein n=1 Tax=Streptomyces shenzhenensis TaxID=943815 RepID=UPI003D8AE036
MLWFGSWEDSRARAAPRRRRRARGPARCSDPCGEGRPRRARKPLGPGARDPGVTNVALDATDPDALTRAADGASAIFHTANPGPYPVWDRQWPLMSSALLTATERTGAVYAMAGNLYPLGPVTAPMHEGMPDDARDHLGALRARVWADALAAHRAGRIRAFEVRGSDYIGGESAAGHIGRALPTALKGKTVRMVGRVDTPHTFTDVNDVARLLVTVYDAPMRMEGCGTFPATHREHSGR